MHDVYLQSAAGAPQIALRAIYACAMHTHAEVPSAAEPPLPVTSDKNQRKKDSLMPDCLILIILCLPQGILFPVAVNLSFQERQGESKTR